MGAVLEGRPGLYEVRVSVSRSTVLVRYDGDQLTAEELARLLDESSYSCRPTRLDVRVFPEDTTSPRSR